LPQDSAPTLNALAREKGLEAIGRLVPILQSAQGEIRAEMMLRLAELYVQQGRSLYLEEMAACTDKESCDNSVSRSWQERSIALSEAVVQGYPRSERADQATYFLATVLDDLGRKDEAADTFRRLVKVYPDSSFAPDAWLLLGVYYFDTQQDAYKALSA